MKYFSSLTIALFTLTACGTAPVKEPVEIYIEDPELETIYEDVKQAKYGFSYLNRVKVVSDFRLKSWQALDRKSLIIHGTEGRSYVLTLSKVDMDIKKSKNLLLGTKNSLITSRLQTGSSMVRVNTSLHRKGTVNGIFELPSAALEEQVKIQVVGTNYAETISPVYFVK